MWVDHKLTKLPMIKTSSFSPFRFKKRNACWKCKAAALDSNNKCIQLWVEKSKLIVSIIAIQRSIWQIIKALLNIGNENCPKLEQKVDKILRYILFAEQTVYKNFDAFNCHLNTRVCSKFVRRLNGKQIPRQVLVDRQIGNVAAQEATGGDPDHPLDSHAIVGPHPNAQLEQIGFRTYRNAVHVRIAPAEPTLQRGRDQFVPINIALLTTVHLTFHLDRDSAAVQIFRITPNWNDGPFEQEHVLVYWKLGCFWQFSVQFPEIFGRPQLFQLHQVAFPVAVRRSNFGFPHPHCPRLIQLVNFRFLFPLHDQHSPTQSPNKLTFKLEQRLLYTLKFRHFKSEPDCQRRTQTM
ncbi:hypothetical protein T07_11163 [Trichinella nelsoni]|uniref:Uncharacterized protein n=1 Tax=Trichinella nelsoni TaxID=6336 RepID=A0A0V0RZ97_9BILA|nr:hypothetical protein T07_11163 [Trichinella nelsoni]